MMSMWSQSAPNLSMRSASDAKLAKSDDSIDGAIFAATPIFQNSQLYSTTFQFGGREDTLTSPRKQS